MSQAQPTLLQGHRQQLVRNVQGTNFKTKRGGQEQGPPPDGGRTVQDPLTETGKAGPGRSACVCCGSVKRPRVCGPGASASPLLSQRKNQRARRPLCRPRWAAGAESLSLAVFHTMHVPRFPASTRSPFCTWRGVCAPASSYEGMETAGAYRKTEGGFPERGGGGEAMGELRKGNMQNYLANLLLTTLSC